MKIVFRVNYHTVSGQSLWLKYAAVLGEEKIRFEQSVPMRWLNDRQWEAVVSVGGSGRFDVEYNYQLHQENGVQLDEWLAPRVVEVDMHAHDAYLLVDDWCSAGTPDHAFQTDAFRAVMPPKETYEKLIIPASANHVFQLRMAAVPKGKVPCLIGGAAEIGNWGWHSAVPLVETAPDRWEAAVHLPTDWQVEYKYALYDPALKCVVSMELGENRSLGPRKSADNPLVKVTSECYRRDAGTLYRAAGVAIPVFSLRTEDGMGVGEFADLKPMADWSKSAGLKLIQILPINDTTSSHSWRDSYPYSAISVFALHPIYLRIDDIGLKMDEAFEKELDLAKIELNALPELNYEEVIQRKTALTRRIFEKHSTRILQSDVFTRFLEMNRHWVVPYAVFCVKRDHYGTADFSHWEDWAIYDPSKVDADAKPDSEHWHEVAYHIWLQQLLDGQLADAVEHLHSKGIALKGDLPIGIDRESVEAWASPHLFKMDSQAGAPPDAFAVKGQNWGFPTYNWEVMRRDGYEWWRSRFEQLSRYFDAYRIDHILGFFRIWQVPSHQVEGIMGYFDPAIPVRLEEFAERGIAFDYNRFCKPYILGHHIRSKFGDAADYVRENFLNDCGHGYYQLREHVLTQRRIVDWFEEYPHDEFISKGLLDFATEVLFFEVPGSNGTQFHPRYGIKDTNSYRDLPAELRLKLDDLYVDYFFHRQEEFWEACGYAKLPAMRRASSMLLCGEDLGMVPACVPGVLKELGILSLEIQRMPKVADLDIFHPKDAPYMSVVSPSTHDMATLRGWWRENHLITGKFAWQMFGVSFPEADLSGEMAGKIIWQHLQSPAMWTIFPLQDLLAMDEQLRNPDVEAERINVPAIMPYNWRYRMHLDLGKLSSEEGFNGRLARLVQASGR